MPKHLIAFKRATATTSDFDPMDAVRDAVLALASSTTFFVPAGARIVAAYVGCGSGGLTDARLNSPTFRRVALPAVRPLNGQRAAGDDPNLMVIVDRPLRYPDIDTLSCEITQPSGTTPEAIAFVWLAVDDDPIPPGDTFWLRYTNIAAGPSATALEWSAMPISFDQLPEGEYIVCGMEHISATCLGARLVFPGSAWRPGTLGLSSATFQNHAVFYDDRLGVYGRFNAFAPPSVEVLCTGTDATFTGYLRVLRVK